jgi:glutathione S-transferase
MTPKQTFLYEAQKMQLIYDPASTSSRIVTFFLHDNGVDFDGRIVRVLAGEQYNPDFATVNPNCEVPVLVEEDGFRLTQSSVIIRYLADRRGLDVYPADPRERVRVDEAISWFKTNFHTYHCALLSYTHILPTFFTMDPAMLATVRAIGRGGSDKYLKVLNDHMIGGNDYVCGDRITLADYVGAANVTLGYAAGINFSAYPNVARWLKTLRHHKGWAPAYSAFEAMIAAAAVQKVA